MFDLNLLLKYIDIIILLLLIIFLFFTFKKILGKKIGYTRDNHNLDKVSLKSSDYKEEKVDSNIIKVPSYPQGSLSYNLELIRNKDSNFDDTLFIEYAKDTFKSILLAFSKDNIESIKELMNENIYNNYYSIIENRKINKEKIYIKLKEFLLVSFYDIKVDASNTAYIEIKFISNQDRHICYDDPTNNNIKQSNKKENKFTDIWTFSKKLDSDDSSWKVIKT